MVVTTDDDDNDGDGGDDSMMVSVMMMMMMVMMAVMVPVMVKTAMLTRMGMTNCGGLGCASMNHADGATHATHYFNS